jgi:hypothetical protein
MTPFPVRTRVVRTNALQGLGAFESPQIRNFKQSHPPLVPFTTDSVGDAIRRSDAAANDLFNQIASVTNEHNVKLAAGPQGRMVNVGGAGKMGMDSKMEWQGESFASWSSAVNALASQRQSLIGRFNNALNVAKGLLTQPETYQGYIIKPESVGGQVRYDVYNADNSLFYKGAESREAARSAVDTFLAKQAEEQRESERASGEAAARADAAAAVTDAQTASGTAAPASTATKAVLIGGAALAAFALFK